MSASGGLINGNWKQVGIQLLAIVVVWIFSFGMTWIIGKLIDITMGLRVSKTEESVGLDISQHGESAYGQDL
jgi:Amt family ammonium transporter